MALINTTTTGVLGTTVYGDGQGALTVQQDGVTINKVVNSPVFRAYSSANQTITNGTFTKVAINMKSFDTANCFDATNYRWTPNVAGYYQISYRAVPISTTTLTRYIFSIRVNGAETTYGRNIDNPYYSSTFAMVAGTQMVYLNGTTDYVELYTYLTGTGTLSIGQSDANTNELTGFLIKAI